MPRRVTGPAVDGLGGPVRAVGPVEEGEDVPHAVFRQIEVDVFGG